MENNINPIKLFFKESWLLIVAALCFGLLLSGVNYALKPKIEANKTAGENKALSELIPEATDFSAAIDNDSIEGIAHPVTLYKAQNKGKNLGWIFNATGAGYADKIDLLIAVDEKFEKIIGYNVQFSNETVGFGDKIYDSYFKDQFVSAPVEKLDLQKTGDETIKDNTIIAITGATITSNAVIDIFNNHLLAVKKAATEKGLLKK